MINHIAVVMDGNGRWAKKRGMPRNYGHREGVKTLEKISSFVFESGVKFFTVYAFSTENKSRSEEEIVGLVGLIKEFFKKKMKVFIKDKIKIEIIGDLDFFDKSTRDILENAKKETALFTEKMLIFALNYGARDEIARAANKAIERGEKITQEEFSTLLDTSFAPDPDIFIRTGGDRRISNFLLYQIAYAELFFVDTLWPDFTTKEIENIMLEFSLRERRFGK